jgi:hypothetical protein
VTRAAQVPVGSQAERFAADPPRPVFGDILLAKLKPGQQIDIECRVRAARLSSFGVGGGGGGGWVGGGGGGGGGGVE